MKSSLSVLMLSVSLLGALPSANANMLGGMHVRGTIHKDMHTQVVRYNLTIGELDLNYKVEGATTVVPQFALVISEHRANFGTVRVTKTGYPNNVMQTARIPNSGVLTIYPRQRTTRGLRLAGVPITGTYEEGVFDAGIFFSGLTVDGVAVGGALDFDSVNGYLSPYPFFSWGGMPVRSHNRDGYVFNYDDARGQNLVFSSMEFGPFTVRGRMQFTDATHTETDTDCNTDSDGNTDCDTTTTTVLDARTASVDFYLANTSGNPMEVNPPGQPEGSSERSLRNYIAFLELLSHSLL